MFLEILCASLAGIAIVMVAVSRLEQPIIVVFHNNRRRITDYFYPCQPISDEVQHVQPISSEVHPEPQAVQGPRQMVITDDIVAKLHAQLPMENARKECDACPPLTTTGRGRRRVVVVFETTVFEACSDTTASLATDTIVVPRQIEETEQASCGIRADVNIQESPRSILRKPKSSRSSVITTSATADQADSSDVTSCGYSHDVTVPSSVRQRVIVDGSDRFDTSATSNRERDDEQVHREIFFNH